MELFDAKGCLSEEGLQALVGGQLDETQRLEAAEHLAYCDRCMDRYTALLTDDVLGKPVNDKAPQQSTAPLGKPIEDKKQLTEKLSDALDALLHHSADTTEK